MQRALGDKTLAVLVVVFTLSSGWLLHNNPFGEGAINWPIALLIALAANLFFVYLLAAWAAPYLASTGGRAGAEEADPHAVRIAERWTAGTLLLFGTLGLLAVSLSSQDVVITPSERLDKNAELVKQTVEAQAPAEYQRQLGGADTWKMSEKTYRTCVPKPESLTVGFCVLVQVQPDDSLKVVRVGEAKSNAAQALEWHPDLADER